MPMQYMEHALTGTPLLLPSQSLQLPCPGIPLEAIGDIFALIEDARMPTPAVPNTRDRMRSIAENRPNTPVMIHQRYRFPNWITRGAPPQTMDGCKLLVKCERGRTVLGKTTRVVFGLVLVGSQFIVRCYSPFSHLSPAPALPRTRPHCRRHL